MTMIKITALVDEHHRLSAQVPLNVRSGPVEVLVVVPSSDEDDAGTEWATGIAQEWEAELADPREDIYSLTDGVPINANG